MDEDQLWEQWLKEKAHQKSDPVAREYWIGVFLSKSGPAPFVCRKKSNFPDGVVLSQKVLILGNTALDEAKKLVKQFEKEEAERAEIARKASLSLSAGSVALFDDGDAHLAVVLEIRKSQVLAVFLTSKPDWTDQCRLATAEELALIGGATRKKTWLAGVVRPEASFIPKRRSVPDHMVQSLLAEFGSVWDDEQT